MEPSRGSATAEPRDQIPAPEKKKNGRRKKSKIEKAQNSTERYIENAEFSISVMLILKQVVVSSYVDRTVTKIRDRKREEKKNKRIRHGRATQPNTRALEKEIKRDKDEIRTAQKKEKRKKNVLFDECLTDMYTN